MLPERYWKKKKGQTSKQSFVNAVIKIRIPEMNSMIYSKNLIRMFEIVDGKQPKSD